MANIIDAIKSLFRRKVQDELTAARERYDNALREIRRVQLTNANAYAASKLEQLQSLGTPVWSPARDKRLSPANSAAPIYRPLPVYEQNKTTGFPYECKLHWEQIKPEHAKLFESDPLFGWGIDPLKIGDWALGGAGVAINSFPREMYPDRPSSLRTQIAMDAVRLISRRFFELVPQYSGAIKHLRNYVVGSGMSTDVTSEKNEPLAQEVGEWLKKFAKYQQNALHRRVRESVLNLFRDGEDALRLFPGKEFPKLRSVDTSTIRGPHNEITGPWAFGVLTSWPDDWEDVQAYHLWKSDNTHENVSPKQLKLAKLDSTGSNVKRGVPLVWCIREQLEQLQTLLRAMAVGEAARQSIPYAVQYQTADRNAVREALPSVFDDDRRYAHGGDLFEDGYCNQDEIVPGQVQHMSKGREFVSPPQGYAHQGSDAYLSVCQAVANGLNVPLWMVMATVKEETYASALVAESPLVKLVEGYQLTVCDHYEDTQKSAVQMAAAQGTFPPDVLEQVEIHCTLPTPISRDRKSEVECDLLMVDKNLMSPQSFCSRNDIDFKDEQELISQAKAEGWKTPAEQYAELVGENGGMDQESAQDEGGAAPNSEAKP